jgi:hypothetical protein
LSISPATKITLGTSVQFDIEITDNVGVGSHPISSKLISPNNLEVSTGGGFLPTLRSGNSKQGVYNINMSIPTAANGGIIGIYKLLIFLTDAKFNTSGWFEISSITVE